MVALTMGVAITTDTTDSVRTSFGRPRNLYGMSVQVLAEKRLFLFKKERFENVQTFNKSRYNFEKKVSEFLKIWQKPRFLSCSRFFIDN